MDMKTCTDCTRHTEMFHLLYFYILQFVLVYSKMPSIRFSDNKVLLVQHLMSVEICLIHCESSIK
jgi:hypothetical protein